MSGRVGDRRAFTLVELLVVIGIIAVLVAILLPALNAAKQHANTLKCASNLRTIGQMMHTYANDNKGKVPLDYWYDDAAMQYTNGHIFWAESFAIALMKGKKFPTNTPRTQNRDQSLVPHLAAIEIYQCPNFPDENSPLDYTINGWAGGGGSTGMLPLTRMRRGASIVYITEKHPRLPTNNFMQCDIFDNSHLPTTPPGSKTINPNSRMLNDQRHRGKANALYCDGHVDGKPYSDFVRRDFDPTIN